MLCIESTPQQTSAWSLNIKSRIAYSVTDYSTKGGRGGRGGGEEEEEFSEMNFFTFWGSTEESTFFW